MIEHGFYQVYLCGSLGFVEFEVAEIEIKREGTDSSLAGIGEGFGRASQLNILLGAWSYMGRGLFCYARWMD